VFALVVVALSALEEFLLTNVRILRATGEDRRKNTHCDDRPPEARWFCHAGSLQAPMSALRCALSMTCCTKVLSSREPGKVTAVIIADIRAASAATGAKCELNACGQALW